MQILWQKTDLLELNYQVYQKAVFKLKAYFKKRNFIKIETVLSFRSFAIH